MRRTIAQKLTAARQARAREAAFGPMPPLKPLHSLTTGQHVTVSHPARGPVTAEVLHVETPAALPSISGAPEIALVRSILAERHVRQLAIIAHQHNGQRVMFVAFTDGRGNWWDLQQQTLTITEAPPHAD
jgi:hypothetical protein